MAVSLCNLKGFCYMYSLQVGVAIISAMGLTLMTIVVVLNFAQVAKSDAEEHNGSLGQSMSQFFVFAVFVVFGYVIYSYALKGAYQEEIKPLKTAIALMIIQFIIWLVLIVLSIPQIGALGYTCVQSLRCADGFFTYSSYYRKAQLYPDYAYVYVCDEHPQHVFSTKTACLAHCRGVPEAPQNGTRSIADLRAARCRCSLREKEFNSIGHHESGLGTLLLTIILAVVITIFWYLYPLLIMISYINHLKKVTEGRISPEASKTSIE